MRLIYYDRQGQETTIDNKYALAKQEGKQCYIRWNPFHHTIFDVQLHTYPDDILFSQEWHKVTKPTLTKYLRYLKNPTSTIYQSIQHMIQDKTTLQTKHLPLSQHRAL